jgi:D-sedoheptulose 7-phosphate isomerase
MVIPEIIECYLCGVSAAQQSLPIDKINQVVELLEEARLKSRRVFTFGNGGSASTASHFASDLAKGAICDGKPRIKAIALTDNIPVLSAWANDTAYENVFAEQLENLVEPEDTVIAISGSGNSPNVLKGVELAMAKGAKTVGFTGFEGGKLKDLVDIAIIVPIHDMRQIEDIHLLLCHAITTCLSQAA